MTASHWRARAREVIADVIERVGTADVEATIRAIDAAYPFGEREHWPYRMWLRERRAALTVLRGDAPQLTRACPACGAAPGKRCKEISTGEERAPHVSRGVQLCLLCGAAEGEACKGAHAELCAPGVTRG